MALGYRRITNDYVVANILNVPDGVLILIFRFAVADVPVKSVAFFGLFPLLSLIDNSSNIKLPCTNLKFGWSVVVFKPSSLGINGGEVSVGGQHKV